MNLDQFPKHKKLMQDLELRYLTDALKLSDNDIPKTIKLTAIPRATLYRMLKKYNLHIYARMDA
jgi:DNA-binding NtrC family response regulator